jgi:hypothetical protein
MTVSLLVSTVVLFDTGAAQGHNYPACKDAVDSTPSTGRRIRYVDQSKYPNAVIHARTVWNNVATDANNPLVKVAQSGQQITLEVFSAAKTGDYLGKWIPGKPAHIVFNTNQLGPPAKAA